MIVSAINTLCSETIEIWYIIGLAILILKFSFPIIIIVMGMLDFGKAIFASEKDKISDKFKKIIKRIFIGVIIFFIPTIIYWMFNLFGDFNNIENNFYACRECLFHPTRQACRYERDQ